jgi:hypothetical protein
MKYDGDDGFDKFFAQGGAGSNDEFAAFLSGYISKAGCLTPHILPEKGHDRQCPSLPAISAKTEFRHREYAFRW